MSVRVIEANFKGKDGKAVPWVRVAEGRIPGTKRDRAGEAGINPVMVLSILENADALRDVCARAIIKAEAENGSGSTPPPPPPSSEPLFYLGFNGQFMTKEPVTKAEACKIVRDGYLALPTNGTQWKPAAEYGIVPPVSKSPPPPAAPKVNGKSVDDDAGEDDDEELADPSDLAKNIASRLLATA